MKPIAIFRHAPGEGAGYLAEFLHRHGVPLTAICIDQGAPLPASVAPYSALVFMGGPMSANDDLPWIPQALRLIREAQNTGLPVLGHCLGGQLISKALGGQVTRNPVPEIGWGMVQGIATDVGQRWLRQLPPAFEVFHWHGETFTIPAGATHLLAGPFCPHQGFAIGRTLALQCHIEMTSAMIEQWTGSPEGQALVASPSVQTPSSIYERLHERLEALHRVADVLYGEWLGSACA